MESSTIMVNNPNITTPGTVVSMSTKIPVKDIRNNAPNHDDDHDMNMSNETPPSMLPFCTSLQDLPCDIQPMFTHIFVIHPELIPFQAWMIQIFVSCNQTFQEFTMLNVTEVLLNCMVSVAQIDQLTKGKGGGSLKKRIVIELLDMLVTHQVNKRYMYTDNTGNRNSSNNNKKNQESENMYLNEELQISALRSFVLHTAPILIDQYITIQEGNLIINACQNDNNSSSVGAGKKQSVIQSICGLLFCCLVTAANTRIHQTNN